MIGTGQYKDKINVKVVPSWLCLYRQCEMTTTKPTPPPIRIGVQGAIIMHPRGVPSYFSVGSEHHKAYEHWKTLPFWLKLFKSSYFDC